MDKGALLLTRSSWLLRGIWEESSLLGSSRESALSPQTFSPLVTLSNSTGLIAIDTRHIAPQVAIATYWDAVAGYIRELHYNRAANRSSLRKA